MEPTSTGELVHVGGQGPALDGIVFDSPSRTKVVVAIVDPARGPIFRTVNPKDLSERAEDGPQDAALRLLMRRTRPPSTGRAGSAEAGRRALPGHTRAATHRSTGK
jgi:hypothetical protein